MYGKFYRKFLLPVSLLVGLLGLTACGAKMGKLTLAVTDAPVDSAEAVFVVFTGVELKPADGRSFHIDFDAPRQIDLLALQGNASEVLLDGEDVPAGNYNWIRLKVSAAMGVLDSYIQFGDGSMRSLYVPSGAQTGLKLGNGFTVPAGGEASFTIDFDLRKSVHSPPGQDPDYFLRPTLRIVNNVEVGSVSGAVSPSLLVGDCSGGNVVYVFAGANVTPDDIDGLGSEPVTTAAVALDANTGDYRYTAGFLLGGDYTVAFTCQGANDAPGTDDALAFVGTANVTVTAGETTVHDF